MIRLSAREHSGTGACRIMASFRQQRSEILQPPLFLQPHCPPLHQRPKKKRCRDKRSEFSVPIPFSRSYKKCCNDCKWCNWRRAAGRTSHLLSHVEKKPHSALSNGSLLCWGQQHYGVESTMEKKGFPAGQCRGFSGTGCCSNTLCLNITC